MYFRFTGGFVVGELVYGTTVYQIEDRLLAHFQLVVGMKLRRSENFFVSWSNPSALGNGRQSVWIDNGVHIAFHYDGSHIPDVNREWIETLADSAHTNFGLQLTDENGEIFCRPVDQSA